MPIDKQPLSATPSCSHPWRCTVGVPLPGTVLPTPNAITLEVLSWRPAIPVVEAVNNLLYVWRRVVLISPNPSILSIAQVHGLGAVLDNEAVHAAVQRRPSA